MIAPEINILPNLPRKEYIMSGTKMGRGKEEARRILYETNRITKLIYGKEVFFLHFGYC